MVDDIRYKRLPSKATDNDAEPTFVPPERLAEEEEVIDMAKQSTKPLPKAKDKQLAPKKPNWRTKIMDRLVAIKTWWAKQGKKQKIAIIVGAMMVLFIILFGLYTVFGKTKPAPVAPVIQQKVEKPPEPPKPTTEASRLTGVQISPELNQLTVTGIMIENSPDARPQSGLNQAGVVFEAIAEGGITRFLTLFQEAQPDYIGPVRSVRPYYLQWLQGFDAAVAHAGGSPVALAKIRNEGIKDLDQFYNGGAYQRISARYAPHNVYTSRSSLLALEKSKGYNSSTFTGFARKAEKPLTLATAKSIDIAISGPLYNVHYDYSLATNSYLRSQAGQPHIDERSGAQLTPKVVIAIVVPQGIDPDGIHTSYQPIGSGTAYIFQDGSVTVGVWSKASDKDQILFGDANSAPLGLNPGQTWITAVGGTTNVGYQP